MNTESKKEQISVLPSAVPSLLTPVRVGGLTLPNRIIVSRMTRARSLSLPKQNNSKGSHGIRSETQIHPASATWDRRDIATLQNHLPASGHTHNFHS